MKAIGSNSPCLFWATKLKDKNAPVARNNLDNYCQLGKMINNPSYCFRECERFTPETDNDEYSNIVFNFVQEAIKIGRFNLKEIENLILLKVQNTKDREK